jgi:uncharacterized membrane protein YkvA (DUF1232 family)
MSNFKEDYMLTAMKNRAHTLKREAYALYIAARDPRVPWYAKVFMGLVVAHTFSPIDLIPDFIPVLGLLDDLIVTPVGIAIALKMIPAEVMADSRHKAEDLMREGKPISRVGVVMVVSIWGIVIIAIVWFIVRSFMK